MLVAVANVDEVRSCGSVTNGVTPQTNWSLQATHGSLVIAENRSSWTELAHVMSCGTGFGEWQDRSRIQLACNVLTALLMALGMVHGRWLSMRRWG